jgi:hypothetical protein
MKKHLLIALFQVLAFSSVYASGETITLFTNNGPISPSGLGLQNACNTVNFRVTPNIPTGSSVSKVDWYADNALVTTVTGGNPFASLRVTSDHFTVYAIVTYGNGTSGTSNSVEVEVKPVFLNDIVAGQDPVFGCTSSISYSTSVESNPFSYSPPGSDYSINWTLPANWAFNGASAGPSITALPDGSTAGNVVATLTMYCGYQTHTTLPITMTAPPPTFSSGGSLCDGGTTSFAINPPCGSTSYTWTIQGDAGITFTNNNLQSLTTSTTTVGLTASSSTPSGTFSVLAVANYPGGFSSSPENSGPIAVGTLDGAVQMNIAGTAYSATTTASVQRTSVYTLSIDPIAGATSYFWSIGDNAILNGGQGTNQVDVIITGSPGSSTSFAVQPVNDCGRGGGLVIQADITGDDGGCCSLLNNMSLQTSPNPVKNDLYVTVADDAKNIAKKTDDTQPAHLNLYDFYTGQLVRSWNLNSSQKQYHLNVAGLKKGQYVLQVITGNQRQFKQILVQ